MSSKPSGGGLRFFAVRRAGIVVVLKDLMLGWEVEEDVRRICEKAMFAREKG